MSAGDETIKLLDTLISYFWIEKSLFSWMDVFGMGMIAETPGLPITRNTGQRKERAILSMTKQLQSVLNAVGGR